MLYILVFIILIASFLIFLGGFFIGHKIGEQGLKIERAQKEVDEDD